MQESTVERIEQPGGVWGADVSVRGQVVGLVGEDVANTTRRRGSVAGVTGDYVDVEVKNGLAGGGSGVEADVVPRRRVALIQLLLDLSHQSH